MDVNTKGQLGSIETESLDDGRPEARICTVTFIVLIVHHGIRT